MKAQERHHLKENPFATTTLRAAQYVRERRRIVGAAVGGLVLVGAIAGIYLFLQSQKADRVSAALGAALLIEQAPIVPAPTLPGASQQAGTYPTEAARGEAAIAAFQKVIDAYPSHEGGTAARYHLGAAYLSLGRAADAERLFAEATASGGSSLYAEMAKLGLAQAQAAGQKYDAAIKTLTDLSGQRDSRLPIDGVLIELARISRKAGKVQDARAAFKRVVDEFPESIYAGEARQQLSTMG